MSEYEVKSPTVLAFQLPFNVNICGKAHAAGAWCVKVGDAAPEVLTDAEFNKRFKRKHEPPGVRDILEPLRRRVVPMIPPPLPDTHPRPWPFDTPYCQFEARTT